MFGILFFALFCVAAVVFVAGAVWLIAREQSRCRHTGAPWCEWCGR